MKSLYLRIWLTVVAVLAAFALVAGWLVQRHFEQERARLEQAAGERLSAWADLLQRALPGADAPRDEQVAALREWSARLRVPLALDDGNGQRIGAVESYLRREQDSGGLRRGVPIRLEDGRTLWVMRAGLFRRGAPAPVPPAGPPMGMMQGPQGVTAGAVSADGVGPPPERPLPMPGIAGLAARMGLQPGLVLLFVVAALFAAVALGAYPVVRQLTRRLEALKRGVETFGAGTLHHRVAEDGRDEVAAVAASFNRAAARIEDLVRSHQSLLANASHELRSPLARMKMALAMLPDAAPAQRERLQAEISANIAELDSLVEEVLLASRLDAGAAPLAQGTVDLLALAAEEAARVDASAEGEALPVRGDERLIRRALRNLLENARRYGQREIQARVCRGAPGRVELQVSDRGPGVPEAYRERVFEPFFRLPGHAEGAGGVGLGLALVRQIAQRHGGTVRCEAPEGGGSRFVISLPAA